LLSVTLGEGDTPLDGERRNLLAGIARPVAAVPHAISLSRDLAATHERLTSATEEERRRLRRDLHDGFGPTLSSAVLGVSRAHALMAARPDAAAQQLDVLTAQLQEAVAEVRRLVYDLRPPGPRPPGLVGALIEHAQRLGQTDVTGSADLSQLSAATEMAAYRIAMEVMTNESGTAE
jgi:two-component system NarL family sensor kinase